MRPLPDLVVRDGKPTSQLDSIYWGVWGGASRQERAKALRELGDVSAAVDTLEATLEIRVNRRLAAFHHRSVHSRQHAAKIERLFGVDPA